MFRFMGVYREQLWFDTPNLAACFLAMLIVICIGLFLSMIKRENIYCKIAAIVPATVALTGQFLLVCTYSRGGYVSLICGLLALLWLTRSKWIFVFAGTFITFLLVVENGAARVGTMGNINDGSIMNRLLLWRGSLILIADKWAFGWGGIFSSGGEYTTWLQPASVNEAYASMLNDFLTIACSWGTIVAGGATFIILLLILYGHYVQKIMNDDLLAGVLAAVICYILCASFSTMFVDKTLQWFLIGLAAIIIIYVGCTACRRKLKMAFRNVIIIGVLTFVICLSLVVTGKTIKRHYPYRHKTHSFSVNGKNISFELAEPTGTVRGTFIICVSPSLNTSQYIREIVRPLLLKGFSVYLLEIDGGMAGMEKLNYALNCILCSRQNVPPICFLADGMGGSLLFIAGTRTAPERLNCIFVHDIPVTWPFEPLSPMEQIATLRVPVIIVVDANHSSNNRDMHNLYNAIVALNKPAKLLEIKAGDMTSVITGEAIVLPMPNNQSL